MHEFIGFANDLLTRPMALVILLSIFFLFFLKSLKLDFPSFIAAVNNVGSQPFALAVMIIGFWMLVECKKFGIDTTIAGGVIGVASNMLQAQIKDATHPPPGSAVKTNVTTEFTSPPANDLNSVDISSSTTARPEDTVKAVNNAATRQGRAYLNQTK
jgi:hypothetical protein